MEMLCLFIYLVFFIFFIIYKLVQSSFQTFYRFLKKVLYFCHYIWYFTFIFVSMHCLIFIFHFFHLISNCLLQHFYGGCFKNPWKKTSIYDLCSCWMSFLIQVVDVPGSWYDKWFKKKTNYIQSILDIIIFNLLFGRGPLGCQPSQGEGVIVHNASM